YRKYLTEKKIATDEELDAIEAQVAEQVESSVKFAQESTDPDISVAYEYVFLD
ncbi:pyruvate dehydrogenase, partial [Streptococcus suis]